MKFLFLGAGAIGTYIGGSLALAGHPVAYVEQPGPVEILRKNGLHLNIAGERRSVFPVAAFQNVAAAMKAGAADVVVIALKSYDTAAVVQSLRAYDGSLPPALCLQNGVENEAALEEVFGRGNVIAGTVTSAVGRGDAGEITLERKRGVGVASGHPLSVPIATALDSAGLKIRLFPDAAAMKWSKLLTNLLANASSAILGITPAAVFANQQLFRMEMEMLRECLHVMRAQRMDTVNLPGTPVRLLAFAIESLPRALAQPILFRAVGGGRGGKLPSLYLDLQSGRGKTEVSWLNGAVARFGERLGVPTPVNRRLTVTLEQLAEGRESPEKYRQNPQSLTDAALSK